MEVQLLKERLVDKDQLTYLQTVAIVTAIQSVASAVLSDKADFSKTGDILRSIRDLLFPEIAEDTAGKAERTKKLMESEMAKGPLTVQRLDYGKQSKKKR